jgi:peroxiredoxin
MAQPTAKPPQVGDPAPLFKLMGINGDFVGKDVMLYRLKGKIVLLDFFATWCMPCKRELPHFQKLWEKYKGSEDVAFYVISIDKTKIEAFQFMQNNAQYTFPVLYDTAQQVALRYGATKIPVFIAVDREGKIHKIFRQEIPELEKTIDDIVASLGGKVPEKAPASK